ncbi:MAG: hypothetical protein ACP5KN_01950 [Armatimonadota bacterium]
MSVAALLTALAPAAPAHEIYYDFSGEACLPGGATLDADRRVEARGGEYVFSATDERGTVSYYVTPGPADGSRGLMAVACCLDGGERFTVTRGVEITVRDQRRREIELDGTVRISAFEEADVAADGPGGYMREPTGHGPCIRLGDTLPVEPHTAGHVTVPLDVEAGRWLLGVRYMDDRDDEADDAFIALSLGGREIGRITLDRDDDAWREALYEVDLPEGAELRIDARSDADGADFCRISHVLVRAADAPALQLSARRDGDALVLEQAGQRGAGAPRLGARVELVGRALRCRLSSVEPVQAPAGVTGIELRPSEPMPGARVLRHPLLSERMVVLGGGGLYSTFVDRFSSHCTSYAPGGSVRDGVVEAFGRVHYLANSARALNECGEDLWICASPRHIDVLPAFAGRRRSAGRGAISHRVVFDHWRMAHGDGLERQIRLMAGCGMTDVLAILHTWMHYGYDRKQPQFTPANPDRWTDEQFRGAIEACGEVGWRVAVHENYNHMDWDSPYNSPTPAREFGEPDRPGDPGPEEAMTLEASAPGEDLSRQPRNAWAFSRLADLRVSPGPLSRPSPPAFPIASDKMLFYSQIESHKIREMYGTTAGYLDVTPTNQPGLATWSTHIDLDARNPNAFGWDQVYRNAWRLFEHHRDIFEITTGEGGAHATYHAGHIDAVERQINERMQALILPEHELRVVRPLSLHHGMGYYTRFFDPDTPSETWDWDLYRAMQIAFGHAGFMGDHLFPGHIPGPEAIREYYLMRALQEAYADAELQAIEYFDDGEWISAEEGLTREYDFTQARLRIRYANELEIALNFDRDQDWRVEVDGQPFVLPPKGWAALCRPLELAAGSTIADGARRDFASCPEYDYRNTRGGDEGWRHMVARRRGLPGLSERQAPGLLVCLSEGAESLRLQVPKTLSAPAGLNLTVINAGEEARVPVSIAGLDAHAPCTAVSYQGDRLGCIRDEAVWDQARRGRWSMSLAYTYTDPGHLDEAAQVPLVDAFDGPPLIVGEERGQPVSAGAGRRENFVEVAAELLYPAQVIAGRPITFKLTQMQFGETVDDDYAEDVRLVLENRETGERVEVPFPEAGAIERTPMTRFGGEVDFPANSITTFEIG